MGQQVECPKFASADVMFVKELGEYLCKQCKQTFDGTPSITPIRIFLSYGHDNNEELVSRIKADLEKRGHDVWFDKNEISLLRNAEFGLIAVGVRNPQSQIRNQQVSVWTRLPSPSA